MKLYEITNEIKKLSDLLDSEEMDEETYKDTLEILNIELQDKSGNIINFINEIEYGNETIAKEIKRLQELKKIRENKIYNLKKYIVMCMNALELKKVETPAGILSFRKSESIEITNSEEIPSEFISFDITEKIDKTALKTAIKGGKVIEGAILKINQNLQIK